MNQIRLRISLLVFIYGIDCLYQYIDAPYPIAYFIAGLAGAITVWLLSPFRKHILVRDVQIIQTIWVAIHSFGFVLYMFWADPDLYDHAQIFLNVIQILWIVLARHDADDCLYSDRFGRFRDSRSRLY